MKFILFNQRYSQYKIPLILKYQENSLLLRMNFLEKLLGYILDSPCIKFIRKILDISLNFSKFLQVKFFFLKQTFFYFSNFKDCGYIKSSEKYCSSSLKEKDYDDNLTDDDSDGEESPDMEVRKRIQIQYQYFILLD